MVNPKAPQAPEANVTVNIYGGENRVAVGNHNDQGDSEQQESRTRWLIGGAITLVAAVLGLLGSLFSGVFSGVGHQTPGGERQSEQQVERATDVDPRSLSLPGQAPERAEEKLDLSVDEGTASGIDD